MKSASDEPYSRVHFIDGAGQILDSVRLTIQARPLPLVPIILI